MEGPTYCATPYLQGPQRQHSNPHQRPELYDSSAVCGHSFPSAQRQGVRELPSHRGHGGLQVGGVCSYEKEIPLHPDKEQLRMLE